MAVKQYVEFLHHGIMFTEKTLEPVRSRDHSKVTIPKSAVGYRFFERQEAKSGKEMLVGSPRNHSEFTLIGRKMSLAEVEREHPHEDILLRNMRENGISHVVRTIFGNFMPVGLRDRVVAETEVKRRR